MEIDVGRLEQYVVVKVSDVFGRVEDQGLMITLDEAATLKDKLRQVLHER